MMNDSNIKITFRDGTKSYTLKTCPREGALWIENEESEGMDISEKALFDLLDEYFKSEF